MPIQDNNLIMHGTRGMLGKQVVFKQWEGDTYLSATPKRQKGLALTDEQVAKQEKFTDCVTYATAAIKDPEVKKHMLQKQSVNKKLSM